MPNPLCLTPMQPQPYPLPQPGRASAATAQHRLRIVRISPVAAARAARPGDARVVPYVEKRSKARGLGLRSCTQLALRAEKAALSTRPCLTGCPKLRTASPSQQLDGWSRPCILWPATHWPPHIGMALGRVQSLYRRCRLDKMSSTGSYGLGLNDCNMITEVRNRKVTGRCR